MKWRVNIMTTLAIGNPPCNRLILKLEYDHTV